MSSLCFVVSFGISSFSQISLCNCCCVDSEVTQFWKTSEACAKQVCRSTSVKSSLLGNALSKEELGSKCSCSGCSSKNLYSTTSANISARIGVKAMIARSYNSASMNCCNLAGSSSIVPASVLPNVSANEVCSPKTEAVSVKDNGRLNKVNSVYGSSKSSRLSCH